MVEKGRLVADPKEKKLVKLFSSKKSRVRGLRLITEPVRVAAKPRWATVDVSVSKRWVDTKLDLLGGQTVVVVAAGRVCLGGEKANCVGPEGDPKRPREVHAFGTTVAVGALCALVGERLYPLSSKKTFEVEEGGRLLLGLATSGDDNPSGGVTAKVGVFYPIIDE